MGPGGGAVGGAARLVGVVIHLGADHGIISDDANGGRRYKFRMRDVRPPGAPPSAKSADDATARAAFADIEASGASRRGEVPRRTFSDLRAV